MMPQSLMRLGALVAVLALAGCTHTQVVNQWQSEVRIEPPPDKVAVLVAVPGDLQRQAYEQVLVDELRGAGVNAVASNQIRGMRGKLDRDKAEAALKAADVDGVIAVFYTGAGVGEVYERSDYYAQFVGSGFYYDWWRPYTGPTYTAVYEVRQGPGAYNVSVDMYVESNYFHIATGEPVWRMVTKTEDVEHSDVAKAVAGEVVAEMRRAGLVN